MSKKTLMILEGILVAMLVLFLAISFTGYLGWHRVTVPVVEALFVIALTALGTSRAKKNLKKENNHV